MMKAACIALTVWIGTIYACELVYCSMSRATTLRRRARMTRQIRDDVAKSTAEWNEAYHRLNNTLNGVEERDGVRTGDLIACDLLGTMHAVYVTGFGQYGIWASGRVENEDVTFFVDRGDIRNIIHPPLSQVPW